MTKSLHDRKRRVSRSWKGDEVQSFIKRILSQCSKLSLRYFVCDKGTNLRCALRAMKMPVIDDCSHVMMNLVKKIFKDDAALSALCASVGRLRSTWALTDKIFLLPPTLRDKDRFLRVFTLVEWMNRINQRSINGRKNMSAKTDTGSENKLKNN